VVALETEYIDAFDLKKKQSHARTRLLAILVKHDPQERKKKENKLKRGGYKVRELATW
jgi:hypothetical protein